MFPVSFTIKKKEIFYTKLSCNASKKIQKTFSVFLQFCCSLSTISFFFLFILSAFTLSCTLHHVPHTKRWEIVGMIHICEHFLLHCISSSTMKWKSNEEKTSNKLRVLVLFSLYNICNKTSMDYINTG